MDPERGREGEVRPSAGAGWGEEGGASGRSREVGLAGIGGPGRGWWAGQRGGWGREVGGAGVCGRSKGWWVGQDRWAEQGLVGWVGIGGQSRGWWAEQGWSGEQGGGQSRVWWAGQG